MDSVTGRCPAAAGAFLPDHASHPIGNANEGCIIGTDVGKSKLHHQVFQEQLPPETVGCAA